MATKIVTKNSSTASAVPTASDLVQGELAVNVADKRLFTEDNAGAIVELGTNPSTLTVTGEITANGGIALGDGDVATFGDSDDLSIFHAGGTTYLTNTTGSLVLRTDSFRVLNTANSEQILHGDANGAVTAYYDNSVKIATTSTGIDVTGTATVDGLISSNVSGTTLIQAVGVDSNGFADVEIKSTGTSGASRLYFSDTAAQSGSIKYSHSDNSMQFATAATERMHIDSSGNVGIGTSPDFPLHVSSTGVVLGLNATSGAVSQRFNENGTARFFLSTLNGSNGLAFVNGDGTSERMRIDSSGSLLVGGTNDNPAGANVAGHALGASGYISTTRDGGFAAFLNRKTSDGEIVRFAKDGTVVGSIGTANGDLYLDSTGGELSIRINGTTLYEFDSNFFYPKVDNSKDLGP